MITDVVNAIGEYYSYNGYNELYMNSDMVGVIGVIVGIIVGVALVIKKLNPVCSLFLGVVTGALVGGAGFAGTLDIILDGTGNIMGVVARIIAGGVLAGVLIESGAAESIAKTIVEKFGAKHVLMGVALASTIITGTGIFMSVGVVILAPIALAVGIKTNVSKGALILALSGGAKAGNMIGPNPNTIAVAEAFGLSASEVMINGILPALIGLTVTVILANLIKNRGSKVLESDVHGEEEEENSNLPSFAKAMVAPVFAIAFLLVGQIGEIARNRFFKKPQNRCFFCIAISSDSWRFSYG